MSAPMNDPYLRLRKPPASSDDEMCRCGAEAIVLQGRLEPNPIACFACNGEVPPERVPVPPELVDDIAAWRDLHDSLYLLWLDCGEYEQWAAGELRDARKPVHTRGLGLVARLHAVRPTFYWWFTDRTSPDEPLVAACPQCRGELTPGGRGRICTLCRIVVSP